MKALKEIGLILLGVLIAFVIILGINLNARLTSAEHNINSIAQFINQKAQALPQQMK